MNLTVSREAITKVSPMFRSVVAAVAALCLLPAAADAAKPRPKAMLDAHKHNTGGNDWHVQLEVNKQSNRLTTIVVYSQKCKGTGFTTKLRMGPGGTFDIVDMPFEDKKGTWTLHGQFDTADRASGTWAVTRGDCTDGGEFRAQDATGHFLVGNPYEYAPKSIRGSSLNARRLRALKYHTGQNARKFDTIAKSRKLGYELSTATGCPGMHHSRKHGTAMWGETLDAKAPQSLVYWCDAENNWTLAAFMYRADGKKRPDTFGGMLQWHKHGPTAHWMTHVWLVKDPVEAFATCAPFNAFAREGQFAYQDYVIDAQVDAPCSDSAPDEQLSSQPGIDQAP
jgi:hypothetical protein